jgi:selenocysteine-specific elongation factor
VTTRNFIIATAGHVDHGKSALVKALTGTDPDRLPEEKKRQITIDLGFAELNVTAPNGDKIHAGIVDVPGHEDFVRNMIAGVGSIDLALFVVAADDGWMPQTEEHLQILSYLGVKRAVIAVSKSDLGKIDRVTEQIRNRLRGTFFLARSPIVPASVRTGEGLEDLKRVIASELTGMQPQRDFGKPRLFIDRVFTLPGIGTVVTGTLTGGRLHRGQTITIQPQKLQARIRSVQSHGAELEAAHPGMRTALNLPEVAIDQMKRGDVITASDIDGTSLRLTAAIEKSGRLYAKEADARPLKTGSSVYLHHGTSRVAARVTLLETNQLDPGKKTMAYLNLASPIVAFVGDRFVLRDASEQHTIGGGVVLDSDAANRPSPAQLKLLATRAAAPEDVDLCIRSEIALRGLVPRRTLLKESHFSAGEIIESLMRLRKDKEIVLHQDIAADGELWQKLRDQAIALIDEAHDRNPERGGLDLNELRSTLRVPTPDIFEALMADLCARDFVRKGSVVARTFHRPQLPAALQPIATDIRQALSQKPFDPPPRREIEPDRNAQHVLRFLVESGEVIEIASDVVLLCENFERMKSEIAGIISKHGPATVSELRQALGTSRRVMVPLLERLDRDRVTRRVGDKRVLARKSGV